MLKSLKRRPLMLAALGAAVSAIAMPVIAQSTASRRAIAPMTDGPFYPPRNWRERSTDWDADLTRVERSGRVATAKGEHLGLDAAVIDTNGRAIDNVEVEIWQCDAIGAYRHPRVPAEPGGFDEGFQGFGAAKSGRDGTLSFRTIRPVPYPGRTPHIHVKLRHASFGEWTSQLFVAGDAGNARDFLWRQLGADERKALEMSIEPAPAASGLKWAVRQALVVPA